MRAWRAQSKLEAYCGKIASWGYDELPFLQRASRDDIVAMVNDASADMKPGHRTEFFVAWEQLTQPGPRLAAEAKEEQQVADEAGRTAVGHQVAATEGREVPVMDSRRSSATDEVASAVVAQVTATAAPGDEITPQEATGRPGPEQDHASEAPLVPAAMTAAAAPAPATGEETDGPKHAAAAVPLAASEPPTAATARATKPSGTPDSATTVLESTPARGHRGTGDDAHETHA